jgi:hypothetical protein
MKAIKWIWRQCSAFVRGCSESCGIGLGDAASWVFSQMTGTKSERLK